MEWQKAQACVFAVHILATDKFPIAYHIYPKYLDTLTLTILALKFKRPFYCLLMSLKLTDEWQTCLSQYLGLLEHFLSSSHAEVNMGILQLVYIKKKLTELGVLRIS